jgi:hypothetical protein
MAGGEQQVAQIRDEGSTEPLPEGWVAEPVRWDGRPMEVAFDPGRHKVLRVRAGQLDRDGLDRQLTSAGWRRVFTDSEGAELWMGSHADVAHARLDRLSQTLVASIERTGPGVSSAPGPTVVGPPTPAAGAGPSSPGVVDL